MSEWTGVIRGWFGVERRAAASVEEPGAPPRSEEVAREAIRLLREAQLDFHRSGQQSLARIYRDRAATLERDLVS